MNRVSKFILTAITVLVALAATTLARDNAKSGGKPIATFRAFAVSMDTGGAGVVQISIDRWSTDAERQSLLTSLATKGPDATMTALMKLPQVGFIQTPSSMGYALFYARQNTLPDGSRQVVIATDRALTFGGMMRQGTFSDYDYSMVEMHFPKGGGKGEGKLILAGKAEINPKTQKFQINNYMGEPVMLKDIEEKQP